MKMGTATKIKISANHTGTAGSGRTGRSTRAAGTSTTTPEEKVRAEIASMLQVNGNTRTAQDWVPRVVMMAYERRCAKNPGNGELAECFSIAQAIAARS